MFQKVRLEETLIKRLTAAMSPSTFPHLIWLFIWDVPGFSLLVPIILVIFHMFYLPPCSKQGHLLLFWAVYQITLAIHPTLKFFRSYKVSKILRGLLLAIINLKAQKNSDFFNQSSEFLNIYELKSQIPNTHYLA